MENRCECLEGRAVQNDKCTSNGANICESCHNVVIDESHISDDDYWQNVTIPVVYYSSYDKRCDSWRVILADSGSGPSPVIIHPSRTSVKAMDSRMTICGDFAENDANINTFQK